MAERVVVAHYLSSDGVCPACNKNVQPMTTCVLVGKHRFHALCAIERGIVTKQQAKIRVRAWTRKF